jgi:thiosulfate reductase cytochrome b subunit
MHWVNAAATVVMMLSGWQIYNAYPVLPFTFPAWSTLGGWLGGALLWHFAAMWVLVINGGAYLTHGIVTGRLRRKFLPLSLSELATDMRSALRLRLEHGDLSVYNAVQRFCYAGVMALLIVAALSGSAVWKPVQLVGLSTMFGGFQGSRIAHFVSMIGILGFLIVHVGMSFLVPKSLLAMLRGH